MSKQIVIAGATGSGKSYYIKNRLLPHLKDRNRWIFDINSEYKEHENKYRFEGISDFLNEVRNVQESVIVFEEATAFFSMTARGNDILTGLMVRKRHQDNVLIFVFHSLRQIPVYMFEFSNYLILFNTNDRADLINAKFKFNPEILEAYNDLQKVDTPFKKVIKKMY